MYMAMSPAVRKPVEVSDPCATCARWEETQMRVPGCEHVYTDRPHVGVVMVVPHVSDGPACLEIAQRLVIEIRDNHPRSWPRRPRFNLSACQVARGQIWSRRRRPNAASAGTRETGARDDVQAAMMAPDPSYHMVFQGLPCALVAGAKLHGSVGYQVRLFPRTSGVLIVTHDVARAQVPTIPKLRPARRLHRRLLRKRNHGVDEEAMASTTLAAGFGGSDEVRRVQWQPHAQVVRGQVCPIAAQERRVVEFCAMHVFLVLSAGHQ
mmetsp:Transcript_95404/g.274754  ORF Transcript_95404/g.274754 Transcript_95404/m.274754 type:complete len:265 (-) Transcript_95404:235-1029(-)